MLLSEFECQRTILIKTTTPPHFLYKKIEKKNYTRHGTLDPPPSTKSWTPHRETKRKNWQVYHIEALQLLLTITL